VSAARVQNEIREFLSIFTDCATPQDAGMLRWRPQEITFVRTRPQSAWELQALLPEEPGPWTLASRRAAIRSRRHVYVNEGGQAIIGNVKRSDTRKLVESVD
jgi:hypothetical protein